VTQGGQSPPLPPLEAIARRVGDRTIATAESITAGRIAAQLATVPGAVEFLRGGLVAYQEQIKRELLGVEAPSVYTPLAVREMALGVAELLGADLAVATTGVAGGDPVDGVPPGTVFIGIAYDGESEARAYRFEGPPEGVADQAVEQALADLARALLPP
jgi:PncC family amidohydrolase